MADQWSMKKLAFNFACRGVAYNRLAEGLGGTVSAFSSFMRKFMDRIVTLDQCAQHVDDFAIVTKNATDLTRDIRTVFECIRRAGLKLGRIETFPTNSASPKSRKALR